MGPNLLIRPVGLSHLKVLPQFSCYCLIYIQFEACSEFWTFKMVAKIGMDKNNQIIQSWLFRVFLPIEFPLK